MRNPKRLSSIAQTVFAICLLSVSPAAFAYLDPTTGSMVVSAIVGIIASIALAVKTYWYRIKGFFRRNSKQDPTSQNTPE
jgi:O-antigen/teichoic acid export membrane protein